MKVSSVSTQRFNDVSHFQSPVTFSHSKDEPKIQLLQKMFSKPPPTFRQFQSVDSSYFCHSECELLRCDYYNEHLLWRRSRSFPVLEALVTLSAASSFVTILGTFFFLLKYKKNYHSFSVTFQAKTADFISSNYFEKCLPIF